MILKEFTEFKLPALRAGSFSGMDRLDIPYNKLILIAVTQRDDNGEIELRCKAIDGPEEKRGNIKSKKLTRVQKNKLYTWFRKQVRLDIETIYDADFHFGGIPENA